MKKTLPFSGLCALLLLSFFICSCNGLCRPLRIKLPCDPCMRRPQVMMSWNDWVLDYSQICPIDPEYDCEPCEYYHNTVCCLPNPFEEDDDCCGNDCNECNTCPHCGESPCCGELEGCCAHGGHGNGHGKKDALPTYRFAIGDLMEISVFGDEETLFESVAVAPDGKIYYAFLGGIEAEGRTSAELSAEIASQLKDLFVDPLVSITPHTAIDFNYRILGRVNFPGVYAINAPLTLRDAIAEAGGILVDYSSSEFAEPLSMADLGASIFVHNGKRVDVDFNNIVNSPLSAADYPVAPGDYIFIAPAYRQDVFVLGAVNAVQRVRYHKCLTLMEALSSSGGWVMGSPYSPDLAKVLVIRNALDCCPCAVQVDVFSILRGEARDLFLQPGDIVYAQHKPWRFARELIRMAVNSWVQAFFTGYASWTAQHFFDFPNCVSDTTAVTDTTGTTTTGF